MSAGDDGVARSMGLDAIAVQSELAALEAEFERATAARPPSDDALKRWDLRLIELSNAVGSEQSPGKLRVLRHLQRFGARLTEMRTTRDLYLARRATAKAVREVNLIWDEAALRPRSPLSAAIHSQLMTGVGSLPAGGLRAQGEPAEPRSSGLHGPSAPAPAQEIDLESHRPSKELPASPGPSLNPEAMPIAASLAVARPNVHLAPELEHRPQRHSSRLDPIIAVEGRLARPGSFLEARDIALTWLRKKGFRTPPESPDSFDVEVKSKGHRAVAIGLPRVWAMQAETADHQMAGRRWRVEMVLVDAEPTPGVAITLTAISAANQPPPAPSIPGLVSALTSEIGLLDQDTGGVLSGDPIRIEDHASLHRLVRTLVSPDRLRPAVVLSTYLRQGVPTTLLDPVGLATKLGSLARVYVLSREMTWALTEALSRRFSVAGATVRLFRPGFTRDDESGRHPSWGPTELTAQSLTLNGLSHRFLSESADASLRALEREDAIPAFERVREQVLRQQIRDAKREAKAVATAGAERGSSSDQEAISLALLNAEELTRLFESDNDQLRRDLQRLREERDTQRARIFHLESRLTDLEIKLLEQQGSAAPAFPPDWDELEEWCEENLGERVVLTNKAIRAAQGSPFLNVPFAYEVLWFLRSTYVPSKQGRLEGGVDRLNAELGRLGIEISAVGKAAEERRSKETYSANYKRGRVLLDMHVKGSSDRDPRYGFRVYFHWHEGDQCVVVGWLPGHLDNALT